MNAGREAVRLVIRGRVQGVGYRAWLAREAARHDLSGWVRNRRDGAVEATLAGPAEAVAAVVRACGQGPEAAVVDDIAVQPGSEPAEPGFRVLPTE